MADPGVVDIVYFRDPKEQKHLIKLFVTPPDGTAFDTDSAQLSHSTVAALPSSLQRSGSNSFPS
jgi:hypothetical protein